MQMLIYRFAKKNIHKYTKIKWFHMWLHMNMKKAEIRFFDFVVTVLVCIVWKIWLLPFI